MAALVSDETDGELRAVALGYLDETRFGGNGVRSSDTAEQRCGRGGKRKEKVSYMVCFRYKCINVR